MNIDMYTFMRVLQETECGGKRETEDKEMCLWR